MKQVMVLAGFALSLLVMGCASTRQAQVASQDGVPIACAATPAQGEDDGDCDAAGQQIEAIKSASTSVYYKIERDSQPAQPYDPGVIPNFGR